MFLYEVVTANEIEEMFSLPEGSVRRDISRGKFRKAEIRKSGGTWLITAREARRVYTGQLTFIPVINDWEWVLRHVKDELSNPVFDELVRSVLDKPYMDENDVKNLTSLYWEGLENGLEDGKYISFSQWFYEFYEDEILALES